MNETKKGVPVEQAALPSDIESLIHGLDETLEALADSGAETFIEESLASCVARLKSELDDDLRLGLLSSLGDRLARISEIAANGKALTSRAQEKNAILCAALAEFANDLKRRRDDCPVEVVRDYRKSSQPKVSVVIPIYDASRYLRATLESVRDQTLYDIEIICVDDGSADDSPQILLEFAESDGRFMALRQENRGVASARNTGLKFARGRYVYFLDSDDLLEACALEVLSDRAERDQLDVAYFDAESFYESEDLEERFPGFRNAYQRTGSYDGVYGGAELLAAFYRNQDEYVPSTMAFFRSDFLHKNNLSFADGIVQEDNDFYFVTGLYAKRAAYVPLCLYKRRVREGSVMTSSLSFRNVYGYYASALDMLRVYFEREDSISLRSRGPLKAIVFRTLNTAAEIMSRLPVVEWHSIYGLEDDCWAMNYAVNSPAWIAFCRDEGLRRLKEEQACKRALKGQIAALERNLQAERESSDLLRSSLSDERAKLREAQGKIRVLRQRCQERKEKLQKERVARRKAEEGIERIRKSRSYRLGCFLLRPLVVLRHFGGKVKQRLLKKSGDRSQ